MVSLEELEQIVRAEITQRREEGYDICQIEAKFLERKKKSVKELEKLLAKLERSPFRSDFHYNEPSELRQIEDQRPKRPETIEIVLSDSELYNRIYGGWLGRCAGCLLGKPVEGLAKDQIEQWLRLAEAYPLSNYFPPLPTHTKGLPEWLLERWERLMGGKTRALLGSINCMARDDDIDYTIMGLQILETYGPSFTTMNIGDSWLSLLPYRQVYTAERVAYRNLVNGILPPESATYMNPYREWIGAQIRGDMWGYVAPGAPDLAADMAFRDARLSHVKNGIYGEMFISAMISAAFTAESIDDIIEAGLSVIPRDSRLAEAVKDTVSWGRQSNDWRDTWLRVVQKYGHYHPVHTINNAAFVILGLVYGQGDYERTITTSVMCGLDTDCNGATSGSILGVMLGARDLPDKWIKPLKDRVESSITGYTGIRISELAKRTLRIAKELRETEERQ